MSFNNWKGFSWDNNTSTLDVSAGNIGVNSDIYFRNTNATFKGTYDSLKNKPNQGYKYKYSNNLVMNSVSSGTFRFNKSDIKLSTKFSINKLDNEANNIISLLELFHKSNNSSKSLVSITDTTNYENKVVFTIESLDSESTNLKIYNIKDIVSLKNQFSNNAICMLEVSLIGNKGDSGLKGDEGLKGEQGDSRYSGS